ncbi:MAG: DNA (cytosine-5-)-methyltransferase [Fusobacterium necrophorum]|nr:DNA (cytosine-5-)-methyltransferase [Fusobacterium necrophorum]
MIKVGTVFSGIGAVEHALERMNIDFNIEFACDNGDVDILSKKIDEDFLSIKSELIDIRSRFESIDETSLMEIEMEFENLLHKVNSQDIDFKTNEIVYERYLQTHKINLSQRKAYEALIYEANNAKLNEDKLLKMMKFSVKLESDIKKSDLSQEEKLDLVNDISKNNYEYKKTLKKIKLLSEKLSMLHERINTEAIRKDVFSMKTLKEQKSYVDQLYAKYNSQNKVKQSYLANYDCLEENFHWNVSFFDGRNFENKIDLLVGGSPCQSFSLVGKQRGLDDTRGTLFYEYARLIKEIRPKVFIYENVKAILSNDNGETWKTISKIFEDLEYNWTSDILNAKDFGIPQNRERLFVVGFRRDLNIDGFNFPKKIKLEKTMKDFLLDNVSGKYYLPKKGVDFVTADKNLEKRYTQIDGDIQLCQKKNQQFNWHGDFIFEEENTDKEKLIDDLEKYFLSEKVKKYVLSTGTKGFYSKPEVDLEIARPLLQSMHKMHRAGVDNYVTTNGRLRKLAPRECLRLMGFCDSFKIVVSDTAAYQQSGNSIVVDVLINLLNEIIKAYPGLLGGHEDE